MSAGIIVDGLKDVFFAAGMGEGVYWPSLLWFSFGGGAGLLRIDFCGDIRPVVFELKPMR